MTTNRHHPPVTERDLPADMRLVQRCQPCDGSGWIEEHEGCGDGLECWACHGTGERMVTSGRTNSTNTTGSK